MNKSKITEIKCGSKMSGQYGDYFPCFVRFENEDSGTLNAKTADAHKVGDELEYEINNGKISLKKKNSFAGKPSGKSLPVVALECAVNFHCRMPESSDTDVLKTADVFLEWLKGQG